MNLLIPYNQMRDEVDPLFQEFTYGDVRSRAHQIKNELLRGDYVFFHTSQRGKKYITAYYVFDRWIDTAAACTDPVIWGKYHNPRRCARRKK